MLAERVLLMHDGNLLTKGSPLYLKHEYGTGYRLTVAKHMLPPDATAANQCYHHSNDITPTHH